MLQNLQQEPIPRMYDIEPYTYQNDKNKSFYRASGRFL